MHESQAWPPVTVWSVCCLGLPFRIFTSLSCSRPHTAPNDPSAQLGCLQRCRALSPVCRTLCPFPSPVKPAAFTASTCPCSVKPALNIAPLPGTSLPKCFLSWADGRSPWQLPVLLRGLVFCLHPPSAPPVSSGFCYCPADGAHLPVQVVLWGQELRNSPGCLSPIPT